MALVLKNPPADAGDLRDTGSIPGSRRSPRVGHSSPLQCSRLENPMDRGAWRATVHGVTESRTRLKRLTDVNSLELVPLRDKNGSEIKSQTKSTGFPAFLCSKGETEDVKRKHPFSASPLFEMASPACGSKGRGGGTDRGRHVSRTEDPWVRPKVALPLPGKSSCWKLLPVQPGPRLPPRLTSEQRPLISAQSRLCRPPPGAFLPSPGPGRDLAGATFRLASEGPPG